MITRTCIKVAQRQSFPPVWMLQAGLAMGREPNPGATPVLLLADSTNARLIRHAFRDDIAWTVTDNPERARALAATRGFVAIVATRELAGLVKDAVAIDPTNPASLTSTVGAAIADASILRASDAIATLAYDEYIELARYATTRRYLIALLRHHGGSVTEAARGAAMKRESLHRLLRRHHLVADDFRER